MKNPYDRSTSARQTQLFYDVQRDVARETQAKMDSLTYDKGWADGNARKPAISTHPQYARGWRDGSESPQE